MQLQAVIWDIDGTLVDSEPLHFRALLETGTTYGADLSDLGIEEFIGIGLHGVWNRLKSRFPHGLQREEWIARLNEHYVQGSGSLAPMPHALDTLQQLSGLGIRQAAVSNSNRRVVDANLEVLGISRWLEFSLSLDDVTQGKPAPEPYQQALDRLGIQASQAIAVEDSRSGILSATAVGITAFGYCNPDLPTRHHLDDLRQLVHECCRKRGG